METAETAPTTEAASSQRAEHPDARCSVESAYRAHSAQIRRYFARRIGDRQRVEDLTQDVFVALMQNFAEGRAHGDVLVFLYALARRRVVDEYRLTGREHSVALPAADELEDRAPSDLAAAAPVLAHAIADLPPAQRRVMVLRLLEGWPFRVIAVELATTEAACKLRFERGRRVLCEVLEAAGFPASS